VAAVTRDLDESSITDVDGRRLVYDFQLATQ
jgi:hypothetical protein